MLSTAVDHAVASGSEPLLVDLVRRHGLLLLAAGEHARLRDVAARLRPEVLTGDPMLALLAATASLEIGELDTAERLLAAAERVWPADPAPELVALRRVAVARRESMTAEHLGATSEAGIEAAGRLGLGPMAVVERAFLAMAEQRVDTARELAQAALEQAGDNDYLGGPLPHRAERGGGGRGRLPADGRARRARRREGAARAVARHDRRPPSPPTCGPTGRCCSVGPRSASSWPSPRWRSPGRRATTSPRCCSTRRSRRSAARP